jgi:hypothetical protein
MTVVKQLITLTPLEPWFFGTDRTLAYPDVRIQQRDGGYFIQSLDAPSQTTLFGALRYLGIENPDTNFSLSEEDKARIGVNSFRLGDVEQFFGAIKGISPLYLLDAENCFYVPIPFDHDNSVEKDNDCSKKYSPFKREDYISVHTNYGERFLPQQYLEKKGLAEGWLRLSDQTIHNSADLFEKTAEIGINTKKENDGFFKRERKMFHPETAPKGMRFAFFAEVGFEIPERIVYLGQQKSAFLAQPENITLTDTPFLSEGIVYAHSDLYVQNPDKLYAACECIISRITTARPFTTNY